MPPPPVFQALVLSFQVSAPGSPAAGTAYQRHSSLPVRASSAASQPRDPVLTPFATSTLPSTVRGAELKRSLVPNSLTVAIFLSQTISPESRLSAITRPSGRLAITRSSHSAMPRVRERLPSWRTPDWLVQSNSPLLGARASIF